MKFEDMKTIWDSQNAEPLYAVNEAGLRDVLQEKSRKFRRLMRWQEILTYGSTAFVLAALFASLAADYAGIIGKFGPLDQLSRWDKLSLVLSAAFWLRFAWSHHAGKQRQAGLERIHASSLLGEIERDLSQVNYQINARGKLIWDYLPPYAGSVLFALVALRGAGFGAGLTVPLIFVAAIALIIEVRGQQRLVDQQIRPRKRELETLKAKLTQSEG
jgi:hypothetical protein